MLQLANKTPFAASLFLLPNREGIDTTQTDAMSNRFETDVSESPMA